MTEVELAKICVQGLTFLVNLKPVTFKVDQSDFYAAGSVSWFFLVHGGDSVQCSSLLFFK